VAAEQARAEGAQAVAVKDFLKGILTTGDHAQTGRDARVLDVLQDAAGHLSARMPDQPAVEATLHDTLSESFYYLGQYDQARRQAEAAVAIHTRLLSKDHLTTLKSMDNLVAALMGQGHFQEAETLARDVIQRKQTLLSPAQRETLASMYHLSSILLYRGKLAAAETVARQISDTGQRVLPPGDEVTLNGMNDLGVVLRKQKRLEEGEALLHRALELSLRARSEEHPVTLELMTNLVGSLQSNGKLAEAEQLSRRTLALKQQVLGPAHAETIVTQSGLARMLCKQKRPEGEVLLRDLVTLVSAPGFESLNPPEMYVGRLGKCVADFGRWAEAEKLLLSSYEGLTAKLGAADERTRDVRDALVTLYVAWGKTKKAAVWREKPGLHV
jgi:tetratricopeptide (TPR) repeat protein